MAVESKTIFISCGCVNRLVIGEVGAGMGEEEKNKTPVFQSEAAYTWLEQVVGGPRKGKAHLIMDEECLTMAAESGTSHTIPYREIIEVETGDYRVVLHLSSQDQLLLHRFGYAYEGFLNLLFKLRGEMLLEDMLMQEKVLRRGFEAAYTYYNASGETVAEGRCEPRIYETALVLIPEQADPLRLPYSELQDLEVEGHTLTLTSEYGERVVFSRMGYDLDGFRQHLAEAMNRLDERTQRLVQQLVPAADPAQVWKLARVMREGRAASRQEVNAVSRKFWPMLEKKVDESPIKEEYAYLKSLAQTEQMAMGVKRGLMGDLTGDYVWFLFPVYSSDPTQPGNALIMESFSDKETAQATYLFRITGKEEYASGKVDLQAETEQMLRRVNRCMQAINFRREPIYLPKKRLREPSYIKYLYALRRLPALEELRERYLGRVPHTSFEQWQRGVEKLMDSK